MFSACNTTVVVIIWDKLDQLKRKIRLGIYKSFKEYNSSCWYCSEINSDPVREVKPNLTDCVSDWFQKPIYFLFFIFFYTSNTSFSHKRFRFRVIARVYDIITRPSVCNFHVSPNTGFINDQHRVMLYRYTRARVINS